MIQNQVCALPALHKLSIFIYNVYLVFIRSTLTWQDTYLIQLHEQKIEKINKSVWNLAMRSLVDSTVPSSKLAYRFFFFINIFVLQHSRDTKPSPFFHGLHKWQILLRDGNSACDYPKIISWIFHIEWNYKSK